MKGLEGEKFQTDYGYHIEGKNGQGYLTEKVTVDIVSRDKLKWDICYQVQG